MTAKDLADYLAAANIGTVGTDIFYSFVPDKPDALVAVLPTGGWPRDPYIGTRHPTFQLRIRAAAFVDAEAKAAAVAAVFRDGAGAKGNFSIGSDHVFLADFAQEPETAFIGYDANSRAEFSLNLRLDVRG
jgi:hypothetical protein